MAETGRAVKQASPSQHGAVSAQIPIRLPAAGPGGGKILIGPPVHSKGIIKSVSDLFVF